MKKKCEDCGDEFEGRADARFCCDAHKKRFKRLSGTSSVPDKVVPDKSVPDNVPATGGVCPGCLERDAWIEKLEEKQRDWDTRTLILRGHLESMEKRAVVAEKELAGYKRGSQGKPAGPYKGF